MKYELSLYKKKTHTHTGCVRILCKDENRLKGEEKTKAYLEHAHFPSNASNHTGFIFCKVALLKLPIDLEKNITILLDRLAV